MAGVYGDRFLGAPVLVFSRLIAQLFRWAERVMQLGPQHKFRVRTMDGEVDGLFLGQSGCGGAEISACGDGMTAISFSPA